jgi:hypothetical protein
MSANLWSRDEPSRAFILYWLTCARCGGAEVNITVVAQQDAISGTVRCANAETGIGGNAGTSAGSPWKTWRY